MVLKSRLEWQLVKHISRLYWLTVSPDKEHGRYTCGLWQLTVGSDKTREIAWEASDRITESICTDSDDWRWALTRPSWYNDQPLTTAWWRSVRTLKTDAGLWQDARDSTRSLWQDHGNYTCRLWQLTMGSDKTRATACGASDKITATTLTTDHEFWPDSSIAQVASAKWSIVQI